ncbi:MAG: tetratricopeptide repeat protein, partial [Acidobacteria bacterium]|nr:tetratricopeptide repeat protein [Acidobacteriota bacterium]
YYSLLACYNVTLPSEVWPKAERAAIRALENDDQLAEAHAVLAMIQMGYKWDWSAAERECQRALALNPNYATAHDYYAEYCSAMGRHEQAIAAIKRAQELEPLSLIINCDVGCNLFRARQYEQAVDQLRNTIEMDPGFALAHWALGWTYEARGLFQEALAEFEEAFRRFDSGPLMLASMGHAYAACGNTCEALKVLDQLLEISRRRYVSPYDMALLCTGLGDKAQAFDWLEKACQDHPFDLVYLKVEPRLDPLRSDARFESLLQRLGLAR